MANCIRCGRKLPPLTLGKKVCQWCKQHEAAQNSNSDDDVRQEVIRAPWVRRQESSITLTQVLFGANIAVFLAMALASGSIIDFAGLDLRPWGANVGPLTLSGQWWRLLTYMFVHGGILHIGFNMWCLWDLGALCESLYGRWTYLCVYLLTGVAGGVASVAWNPRVLSVGASGAIFGLAGALIASFYLGEFSLPSVAIKGTLRSLLFFAAFNIFFGTMMSGVDNACHFGGLGMGLVLGALIAKFAPHDALRRASVVAVGAVIVVGVALGVAQWRGGPIRMAMAFQALSANQPERAIPQLRNLVRSHPNSAEAHYALAQAYLSQRQLPQAEGEFKRVIELQPQNSGARYDLGIVYLNERRPEDAKSAFQQILAQNANNADGHIGLGLALADEGQPEPAIQEFKRAITLGAQSPGIYYEIGHSYAQLKMYDEAIAAYLKEKETSGDDSDLEAALSDAYQAKGMTQQAQKAANRAMELKNTR
jgi:membrane associated rhomboid family serine protease/Tfp pilus assembly protein PilF